MLLWAVVLGAIIIAWLLKLNKDYYVLAFFAKRLRTVDGTPIEQIVPSPKPSTIFGHTFDWFGYTNREIFDDMRRCAETLKKSYVQYIMGIVAYNVVTAEDSELVLNDPSLIRKGMPYRFLHDFINTGLLTSTDKKWHSRRKMLTPAFHFNILGQFEEVFKEESRKFVQTLNSIDTDVVSLTDLIPKFTLNSVCETALGVKLDQRLDADEYRNSFKMIEECFIRRVANPWYMNDRIYNFFESHKVKPHIDTVHQFSSGIIEKRRQLYAEELEDKKNSEQKVTEDDEFLLKKKRYAMLDTLLNAERDGLINHEGICEEVDTFMFEGFDTTSMGLIFSIMNFGIHQDWQERCYSEIIENIKGDLSELDIAQVNSLKNLDCFLKESLRLYPSVPSIQRETLREAKLGNIILPPGSQIMIHFFDIMRDPRHFPKPEVFDPERFLPENSVGRHPFAYTPFSAGMRNCIGQKFALLEMKTLLIYILKQYKVLPAMEYPMRKGFEVGIIIRTEKNIKVKLQRR